VNLEEISELAQHLSIRERMVAALRDGAMGLEALAEEVEAKPASVERIARRNRARFQLLPGSRVGLLERRAL
jgi:hypothetical protein